jgi:DNA-binding response OmpR family regulator
VTGFRYTSAGWSEARRRRILVAEDDEDMRRLLLDTLTKAGHEAHGVRDGAALLLELARSNRFNWDSVDLVIADVHMPVFSGVRALETMRAVRPRVPFLLITAFGDDDLHARARRLGVALLDKPFSMDGFRGSVAQLLVGTASR